MINTRCPKCHQKLRAQEYTRKRESYLTQFECPSCGVKLRLANEVYLWVLLIFQVIPVSLFAENVGFIDPQLLVNLSSGVMALGCVGLLLRFHYELSG